MTMTRSR